MPKYRILFVVFTILYSSVSYFFADVNAKEDLIFEDLYDFSPNSKITINYKALSVLFSQTSVKARRSSRKSARKPRKIAGTRISYSNPNVSSMEGSRVFYHLLKEDMLKDIQTIRSAMEDLPRIIPLNTLNKQEQLAYWLNLYNLTVYEQIALRYPVRKLKNLRALDGSKKSMWDEKILKVEGIKLSLNDIKYEIIQKKWPKPLIIYGMYQGTIGGPSFRRKAFSGKNVYDQLEENAVEFINSLRGLRFWGKVAKVSKIYKWNSKLFPDFERDLRKHLKFYANRDLIARLNKSTTLKTNIYDWYIADITNGGRAMVKGSASTNPVAYIHSSSHMPHAGKVIESSIYELRSKRNTAFFIDSFLKHNKKYQNGIVTIEDIKKNN